MSRLIQYEDLALAIEPDRDGRHQVRTLSSPCGHATAPFTLPVHRCEVEEMIRAVGTGLFRCPRAGGLQPARHLVCVEPGREPRATFQETGARLFQALFHGAIRDTYLECRGRFQSLPDRGLRIRIVLPADTADSGLLQAIPWELLYSESGFLARDVLTPVVRQIALSGVSAPFPETGAARIRILIAVATPRGLAPLDDADERARILKAWYEQQNAEVKLLLSATLRNLSEALRSDHYQVVHFIAHGCCDAETGVGSLFLATPEGEPDSVSSSVLAATLRASRELRLVFLNSCETAQVGHRPGQNPLLGTAAALVRGGVPAVVAMQFPISDIAARIFSEAVYRSLVRGSSLEAAVADGRLALYQEEPESWEWITPALFTALSESGVFRPLCAAADNRTTREEEAVTRAASLLKTRSYSRARQVVEACLEQGVDLSDLHYYLALALLEGRRPRYLKINEIRQIEASARRALESDGCAAHHFCFLAFLLRDFYLENYLLPAEPSYDELLKRAAAARREPEGLKHLLQLVPASAAEVDRMGEKEGIRE